MYVAPQRSVLCLSTLGPVEQYGLARSFSMTYQAEQRVRRLTERSRALLPAGVGRWFVGRFFLRSRTFLPALGLNVDAALVRGYILFSEVCAGRLGRQGLLV